MEEAEEQGFLEDVNVLQTAEEHAKNLAILKEQKDKRITWVVFCRPSAVVHRSQVESSSIGEAFPVPRTLGCHQLLMFAAGI